MQYEDSDTFFYRDVPPASSSAPASTSTPSRLAPLLPDQQVSHTLELNNNAIAKILAAQRELPTWKSCVLEGTSWEGTAEENREKYLAVMGETQVESESA